MDRAARYRELAAQCRVLAALTVDPEIRDRLMLMAEEYEREAASMRDELEPEPPMPMPAPE